MPPGRTAGTEYAYVPSEEELAALEAELAAQEAVPSPGLGGGSLPPPPAAQAPAPVPLGDTVPPPATSPAQEFYVPPEQIGSGQQAAQPSQTFQPTSEVPPPPPQGPPDDYHRSGAGDLDRSRWDFGSAGTPQRTGPLIDNPAREFAVPPHEPARPYIPPPRDRAPGPPPRTTTGAERINRLNETLSFEDPGITLQDITSWRPQTGLPSGDGPTALDAGFIWGPDVLPRSAPIPSRGPAVRGRAAEIPPPPPPRGWDVNEIIAASRNTGFREPIKGAPAEMPPPPPVSARSQAALDQAAAQRALTPAQRAAARRTAADEQASLLAGEALRARTRPPVEGTPREIPPPPGEAVPAVMPAATAAQGAGLVRRAAGVPARVATAPFRYVRSHPLIAAGAGAIGAAALAANRQPPQDVPQPTGTVSGEQGLDDVFRDTAPVPPGGVPTRPATETATERTLAQDVNNDGVPEADVVFQGDTPIAVIDPETGDRIPLDLSTMSQEEVDAIFADVIARTPAASSPTTTSAPTSSGAVPAPATTTTSSGGGGGGKEWVDYGDGGGGGGWVDYGDSGGGRQSRSRDRFAREEPEFVAEDFMEEADGDRKKATQMAKAANRARRRKRSTGGGTGSDGFWPNFPFDRPPSPIRQHVLTALEESRNKNRRA